MQVTMIWGQNDTTLTLIQKLDAQVLNWIYQNTKQKEISKSSTKLVLKLEVFSIEMLSSGLIGKGILSIHMEELDSSLTDMEQKCTGNRTLKSRKVRYMIR